MQTNGCVARCGWTGCRGHKLSFPSWGDDSKICHPSSVMTNVRERQLLFWGRRGVRCGQNKGEILAPFLRMVASNPTTRMLLHNSWTCLEAILCVEERVIWAFGLGRHERRGKEKICDSYRSPQKVGDDSLFYCCLGVGISILIYSSFWSFFVCLDVFRAL